MRLSVKVFAILSGVALLITGSLYSYSRYVLLSEYAKLEINEVNSDLDRTNKTLLSMLTSLHILNSDWSQWDDAYKFMHTKNNEFIKANMAFTTFENAKLNFILFFDTKGNLFYGANYDLENKKFIPVSSQLIDTIKAEQGFVPQIKRSGSNTGIVKTDKGYLAITANPIMNSQGEGPIAGTLVMGYYFSGAHLAALSDIVQMEVVLYPLPLASNHSHLLPAYQNLLNGSHNEIKVANDSLIDGYTLIRDIDKDPIAILSIKIPRLLYQEGVKIVTSYLLISIGIAFILLLSITFLLKRFVLNRILDISHQVIQIKSNSDFSKRIHSSGSDELTGMVQAMNSLLELIQLSQNQLRYRIFQRTEELERISELNQNLADEVSKQKAIEQSLRQDEKKLRHLAYYDTLTGLPNRYFFHEMAKQLLYKASLEGGGMAILFIDADKFKFVNDTYGHEAGDKFLIHVAENIKQCIKTTDIAARLAGDEFIVCLNHVHDKGLIEAVAAKILNQITTPITLHGTKISSSFSVGIAIFPDDGKTIEDLERHADLAMYYAKKQLETSYCFYDEIKSDAEIH